MLLRLTAVKVSVNRWLKSRQGKEGGREGGGGEGVWLVMRDTARLLDTKPPPPPQICNQALSLTQSCVS